MLATQEVVRGELMYSPQWVLTMDCSHIAYPFSSCSLSLTTPFVVIV